MYITVHELKKRLEDADPFVFIDVRQPNEYAQFNLGATLIPHQTMGDAMWKQLARFKNHEIIIYCEAKTSSRIAFAFLKAGKFTNVRMLEGGLNAWIEAFGTDFQPNKQYLLPIKIKHLMPLN
jgi:rhodanese-related sulfurtransferase